MFYMKFLVELLVIKEVFFLIVSGVGTILVLNLEILNQSDYLRKGYLVFLICPLKKSFYNIHNPAGIKKIVPSGLEPTKIS